MHHFARQLSSPFPLLTAVGAKTRLNEIGTGVIDMRYENPLYMAEDAGSSDLISGGRYFCYQPAEGEKKSDMARHNTEVLLDVLRSEGFAKPNLQPMFPNPPGMLRVEPYSEWLRERIW